MLLSISLRSEEFYYTHTQWWCMLACTRSSCVSVSAPACLCLVRGFYQHTKTRSPHDGIHYTCMKRFWLRPFTVNDKVNRITLFWCRPRFWFPSHFTSRKERAKEGKMEKYKHINWIQIFYHMTCIQKRFNSIQSHAQGLFPLQLLLSFISSKCCCFVLNLILFC